MMQKGIVRPSEAAGHRVDEGCNGIGSALACDPFLQNELDAHLKLNVQRKSKRTSSMFNHA